MAYRRKARTARRSTRSYGSPRGRRTTRRAPVRRRAVSRRGGAGTLKIVIEQAGVASLPRPAGDGQLVAPRKARF